MEKCEICKIQLNYEPEIDEWTKRLTEPQVCSEKCWDIWMSTRGNLTIRVERIDTKRQSG